MHWNAPFSNKTCVLYAICLTEQNSGSQCSTDTLSKKQENKKHTQATHNINNKQNKVPIIISTTWIGLDWFGLEAKLAAIWISACDWIISEQWIYIASNDLDTLQSNIFNRFPLSACCSFRCLEPLGFVCSTSKAIEKGFFDILGSLSVFFPPEVWPRLWTLST